MLKTAHTSSPRNAHSSMPGQGYDSGASLGRQSSSFVVEMSVRVRDLEKAVCDIVEFRTEVLDFLEARVGNRNAKAVRTSVNSLLMTRLWTDALQSSYAHEEYQKDGNLAKGLPAFDWKKDSTALCNFLHMPVVLLHESDFAPDGAIQSLHSAVRHLKSVGVCATPEGKLEALVKARQEVCRVLMDRYAAEGKEDAASHAGESEVAPCMVYAILR